MYVELGLKGERRVRRTPFIKLKNKTNLSGGWTEMRLIFIAEMFEIFIKGTNKEVLDGERGESGAGGQFRRRISNLSRSAAPGVCFVIILKYFLHIK